MQLFKQRPGKMKLQLWEIQLDGNKVRTYWGVVDGEQQETVQEFKGVNIGKANEKTPEQVAKDFFDRQILKKRDREGFREMGDDGKLMEVAEETIDFSKPIPPHARFYKPQNSLPASLIKLCQEGKSWYVRKRNGEMMTAVKHTDGEWRLYSSKMLMCHKNEPGIPWADRYAHIVYDLECAALPPGTILLGELVADRHKDDLYRVGSVTKSLCERAIELQKSGPLTYCIWDIAYWNYACLAKEQSYKNRYDTMTMLFGDPENIPPHKYSHITIPECFAGNRDMTEMLKMAKENGWEGYVVINPDALYGDKALNFRGKAERPVVCGKLKPKLEADFIVRWDPDNGIGTWGKGKKSNGVGAVFAYLLNPETGQEEFISKVGGGLHDDEVARFADPSLYPMVWKVEFSTWTPAGSIQFPEVFRDGGESFVRDDKTIEECTLDQRPDLEDLAE